MADGILNANIPIYGKIDRKIVDLNRAHIAHGQAYSRRLVPLEESAAQKFYASTLPEHTFRQTDFPGLAKIQKDRNEYEDWWRSVPLTKTYAKLSGVVAADRIANQIADNSALQKARDEAYERGDDIYETNKARSAIRRARMGKPNFYRRPSAVENIQSQKNTQIGVEKALGGGKVMRVMRTLFGYNFGLANMLHSIGKFTIGRSLASANSVNQTFLRSLAAGTSFGNVYGLGGVARVFGGNESDAASLFASINRVRTGALMGNGMGPLANAIKYGAVINPFMSEMQMLYSLADAYQRQGLRGPGFQATMASELGIGPWAQRAFSGGAAGLKAFIDKYAPRLTDASRRSRIEQSDAQKELGVAWDQLWSEISIELTPILKEITRYLKALYGEKAYRHELEDYKRKNANATPEQIARHMSESGLGHFIPKTIPNDKKWKFQSAGKLSVLPIYAPESIDNPVYSAYQKLDKENLQNVNPYLMPGAVGGNVYNLNFNSSADPNAIADKVIPAFKSAVNDAHADDVINVTVGGMNAAYSIE